jgi:hypothetical protein
VTALDPWYDKDLEGDRGAEMVKTALALETNPAEGYRQDLNLAMCRMMEGQPISSLYQYAGKYYGTTAQAYTTFDLSDVSTWNVMRSVVMTAAALIGRSSPRGRFLTTAGDWRQKRRARKATQFTDGWADEADLFSVTFQALVDSLVFDFGVVQLYEEDGKVKVQRILASEITVDPLDALYGAPRTFYRRRFIPKETAVRMARKSAEAKTLGESTLDEVLDAIENSPSVDPIGTELPSGLVCVREAWHLPSVPGKEDGSGDGYHVIAVEHTDGTIVVEPWYKNHPSLFFLRWEDARAGFGGLSLCYQLEPMQSTLNRILYRIDRAQRLFSVPRVALLRGSKIVKSTLSNLIAGALEYTVPGGEPKPLVWPAMPSEIYKWVDETVQKMYDLPGISRNASSGVKETGTTSGAAIRESLDVQQTRMQIYAKRWERFHVSIYKAVIDMVSDIVGEGGNYEVAAPGTRVMERVDWSEIKMDAAEYTLQTWPVSMMPLTPQGKLDYIETMLDKGLWDIDRARAALDDLDVESADSITTAIQRMLDKDMEEMLYDGKAKRPDELTPFAQAMKTAGMYMAEGKNVGAPAKNIDLIRRYCDELKRMATRAQGQQGQPSAPVAPVTPEPIQAPPPLSAVAA